MLGKHARPHLAAVGDNRNEAASHRASSRASSRRPIRPPKPSGNVKRKEPKRSVENHELTWRVASAKSTRANRSTAASCEPIKRPGEDRDPITWHHGSTTTKSQLSAPTPTLPTRGDFTLSHPSRPLSRQGSDGGRH